MSLLKKTEFTDFMEKNNFTEKTVSKIVKYFFYQISSYCAISDLQEIPMCIHDKLEKYQLSNFHEIPEKLKISKILNDYEVMFDWLLMLDQILVFN